MINYTPEMTAVRAHWSDIERAEMDAFETFLWRLRNETALERQLRLKLRAHSKSKHTKPRKTRKAKHKR